MYDFSAATSTYYGSSTLDTTSGRWQTAELRPDTSSEANNVKSVIFRLTSTGTVPADFEVNDITISFRRKSVR